LLLCDLDRFQRVSDTAGLAAADGLIARIAQSLATVLRAGDSFGRLGDDEFAILLPDADLAQARRVAERLLRTVRRRRQGAGKEGPGELAVTASIGITSWGSRPIAAG